MFIFDRVLIRYYINS